MARNWVDAAGEPARRPTTLHGVDAAVEEREHPTEVVDDVTDDPPEQRR